MTELFNGRVFTISSSTGTSIWAIIKYEKKREGANMLYRFNYKVYISNSSGSANPSGWYENQLKATFTLNGQNVWEKTTEGSQGWSFEFTTEWFTVKDKTTGTIPFKFTIKDIENPNWCNYVSGTYSLGVDPAGSLLNSISNFNIGNVITVSITKYSSDFIDNLVISYGSTTIKTISDISNGTKVSFTDSELSTIYSLMSSVKSGTFTFTLTSKNGSKTIGTSTQNAIGSITNANPTFLESQITYLDSNSTIVAITENNQYIVRNLSNLKISYTSAIGNKGATIGKYEITFNGVTQTKTISSTIDYGKVNLSSDTNVVIKVIDSRGNYTQVSKKIQIYDWINPTAIISAKRVNNYEDNTNIKVQVSISSVNSKNSIKNINCRYKKTSDTSYSDYQSLTNNIEKIFILDKTFAWNFQVLIEDQFGSTTYNLIVAKGYPIMFFDTKKIAVGVNCFPTSGDSFTVNGNANIDGNLKCGKYFESNYREAFQTGLFGSNNNGFRFKAIRSAIPSNGNYPQYASGMAWATGDTHGLLLADYRESSPQLVVGGGNQDKVNWIRHVAFTEDLTNVAHKSDLVAYITESGSNSNGRYIKYSDGTMVCWGNFSVTGNVTGEWGSLYGQEITNPATFPATFKEVNVVNVNTSGDYSALIGRVNASTSKITFLQIARPWALSNTTLWFDYVARGTWK